MAKKWKVPVYWELKSVMEVEADTLEEAIDTLQTGDNPLPTDGEYVDGSWEAGDDDVEFVRECYNNGQEDEKEDGDIE